MSGKIAGEMISRRTLFWILGLGAAIGTPVAMLTASDAEAQTPGMERREDRRTNRQDRRDDRRTNRQNRRDDRQDRTVGSGSQKE